MTADLRLAAITIGLVLGAGVIAYTLHPGSAYGVGIAIGWFILRLREFE